MKNYIYKDWRTWYEDVKKGCALLFNSMLVFGRCIVLGVVSLIWSVVVAIERFCARETKAALIIGVVAVCIGLACMKMFVSERQARMNAEFERDSLSYELYRITPDTQIHVGYGSK